MKNRAMLSMLVLGLGLSACKGGSSEPAAAGSNPQGAAQEEKVVNLYTWADYFMPEVVEEFTKKTGIKLQIDTFDSNETLLGKLEAGATGYDVIIPSDYAVTILAKRDKLEVLDHTKLPNIINIEDQFRNLPFDPNMQHSVPFLWGSTGLAFLSDKVTDPVDSWSALFKPNPAYQGRISMLKDMREAFGAAFKYQGKSLNTSTDPDIQEALKLLLEQKQAANTLYNSDNYKDLLEQGELWVVQGWSSNISILRYNRKKENVRFNIPKEGSVIYMDNLAIPKGAPHRESAYAFLNYFMDGKPAAAISNTSCGSSPNKAAKPFIRPEMLNDPALYPPPEVLQKLEFIQDVGEGTRALDKAWTELRAQ